MRTTLDIKKELMEQVCKLTSSRTKSLAVNEALAEYVANKQIEGLLSLEGKINIDDNWEEMERIELEEDQSEYQSHS